MTNHPNVGELQSYLDGESAFEHRESVDRHLRRCEGCGRVIVDLQATAALTSGALAVLDAPATDLDAVRWRIRRTRAASRTQSFRRAAAIAASIMVVGAAGWAAAAPGSPLRSLWQREPAAEPAALTGVAPAERAAPSTATIGLSAGVEPVAIVLRGVPEGAEVTVVEVQASDPATATAPESASFSTGEGRIAVDVGSLEGPLSVALPAGVDAEISVNGQAVLRRASGEDTYPGPGPERTAEGLRFRVGAP